MIGTMHYFEQIELLHGVKQKSKAIVVDNNTNKRKKPSSHHKKNANSDKKAKGIKPKGSQNTKMSSKYCVLCKKFGGNPRLHNTKDCRIHMVVSKKCPASDHMTVSDLCASNLKP
eukprot:15248481-Ditylum_brightwellii.AAC.1